MLVVIATSWGALDLESKTDFGKIKLMSHSLGGKSAAIGLWRMVIFLVVRLCIGGADCPGIYT